MDRQGTERQAAQQQQTVERQAAEQQQAIERQGTADRQETEQQLTPQPLTDWQALFQKCELCPRRCGVDRLKGERGYCRAGTQAEVALTMLHKWEEPCISGTEAALKAAENACIGADSDAVSNGTSGVSDTVTRASVGSGAVFFAHCTLGCIYCQNYVISRPAVEPGKRSEKLKLLDADGLAREFLALRDAGAFNINLVTPTHYMPLIAEAVLTARRSGLDIPIVYNTGGFERPEIIRRLEGIVDVFLTDYKYLTDASAHRYSGTDAYCTNAFPALREMFRITGSGLRFDARGMLERGVIVRHLLLPGHAYAASAIIKRLYRVFGDNIVYSLMNQYTPLPDACARLADCPELLRKVEDNEYARAVETLETLGPEHAYIQEGGTVSESFIPDW